MSAESEKSPAFDLGTVTQRYYDQVAIGEDVMWPLVDMYWRDDWREESQEGSRLTVKKESGQKRQVFDACLEAYNLLEGLEDDDDESPELRSVATIALESVVFRQANRNWIIDQAERLGFNANKEWNDKDKITKIGTAYSFDTDYNLSISTCHIIENIAGKVIWRARALRGRADLWHPTSHDDKVDAEVIEEAGEPRLFGPDLVVIRKAVQVLADMDICDTLDDIKKHPVISNTKGKVN